MGIMSCSRGVEIYCFLAEKIAVLALVGLIPDFFVRGFWGISWGKRKYSGRAFYIFLSVYSVGTQFFTYVEFELYRAGTRLYGERRIGGISGAMRRRFLCF